jgi:hypothetical protein
LILVRYSDRASPSDDITGVARIWNEVRGDFAYWNVEGVDDLYQELAGRGALVTSKPQDKPWGLREFTLRTPDGHRITCGEVIKAGRSVRRSRELPEPARE